MVDRETQEAWIEEDNRNSEWAWEQPSEEPEPEVELPFAFSIDTKNPLNNGLVFASGPRWALAFD